MIEVLKYVWLLSNTPIISSKCVTRGPITSICSTRHIHYCSLIIHDRITYLTFFQAIFAYSSSVLITFHKKTYLLPTYELYSLNNNKKKIIIVITKKVPKVLNYLKRVGGLVTQVSDDLIIPFINSFFIVSLITFQGAKWTKPVLRELGHW